ncbi:MAG TPA: nicotinate-nucleotide adenylyltransferase [Candidatus Omnitrophica bacterium]|nr:nicotinate-nucleotide adenylyltransferase [Candidatus Omnitrophota bacterium]
MKIGILGGTFNPIHYGHLILGEQVRGQLELDKVIYVPSFLPPHKSDKDVISGRHRLKMAELAVKYNSHFSVSDIEIRRRGKSYTVDTLREVKKQYPSAELFFICGSDLVAEIPTWKNVADIYKIAKFVLAKRPGFGKRLSGKNFLKIDVAQVDISSSLIRKLVHDGRSILYLTPYSVVKYIEKYKLYCS